MHSPKQAVTNWLNTLQQSLLPISATPPPPPSEKIILILNADTRVLSTLLVQSVVCKILKTGQLGVPKKIYLNTPAKRALLPTPLLNAYATLSFFNAHEYSKNGDFFLSGVDIVSHLTPFLEAGLVYWQDKTTPLTLGPPQTPDLVWETAKNGSQKLGMNNTWARLQSTPPCYLDPETRTIGYITSEIPEKTLATLLNAPALSQSEGKEIRKTLAKLKGAPLPATFKAQKTQDIVPIPTMTLCVETTTHFSRELNVYCGKIEFHYGDIVIDLNETQSVLEKLSQDTLYKIPRNKRLEQDALDILINLDLGAVPSSLSPALHKIKAAMLGDSLHHNASVEDIQALIRILRNRNWKLVFESDFPVQEIIEIDDWYTELNETSESQWFTMELGVMIDGEKVSLLEPLLTFLKKKTAKKLLQGEATSEENTPSRVLIPVGNKMLSFPKSRLVSALRLVSELHTKDPKSKQALLKVSRAKATLLVEMEKAFSATQLRWFGHTDLLNFGKKLQNLDMPKVTIPSTFHATLRTYQEEGVQWLQFLRSHQLGGILADDMGLGKTIQTLAHLMIEKAEGRMQKPCLIVAPTSVIPNWKEEANRFTPTLRVLILQGLDRKASFSDIHTHDLILTTYPLLVRDAKVLLSHDFSLIVLDEAHTIKNAQAKMTQVALQLKADSRLCLTGTPMENHLGELWSLFHFLMPGFLGQKQFFQEYYRTPIEKHQDTNARERLGSQIKPFILRRSKAIVAHELPEKTEVVRHIGLEDSQRDLYESIRLAMHQKVKEAIESQGIERSQIMILDALLKLRQVCCDPRLVKVKGVNTSIPSAKLRYLMDMLPTLLEEGRRILLFSQFTSMLSLIEPELSALNIPYLKLTGDTQNRGELVARFQAGEAPLFLISLKAGGTGLNLTAADTVIHYDPWWNPAVEAQATDRAHRIGQTQAVFVYKLLTEGTVEEKILEMQHKKRNLVDSILNGGTMQSLMDMNDVEALFRG